jgi:glyoxylase-like metal-dependent hydrolase (beta-lactamase superfamily II)
VSESRPSNRAPRQLLDNVYAFPPNRATLGGTAYFIVEKDAEGNPANLLIDTPAWDAETAAFIADLGGVAAWVLTHRAGHGAVATVQNTLQAPILVQEQEAYLLPEVPHLRQYHRSYQLREDAEVVWTPGYSPGSACVYYRRHGGILFSGRHLLPDPHGRITPLRFAKTFHWPRQLAQVQALQQRFTTDPLAYVCPGANTGFLRGRRLVTEAANQLQAIDLGSLRSQQPLL